MANEVESWTKTLVTVLLIPIVLLVLGSYFVPKMIDESNRREALRTARLKKSLDVYTQDTQFTSKLNGVETSMQIFDQLSVRRKLVPSEIKKAQDQFQAEYKERYLALDEIAWWWYWQLEKESSVFE